jgi:hypothetical protein
VALTGHIILDLRMRFLERSRQQSASLGLGAEGGAQR